MNEYFINWLRLNNYVLYANAKGYYIYENDKYLLVVHELRGVLLMRSIDNISKNEDVPIKEVTTQFNLSNK